MKYIYYFVCVMLIVSCTSTKHSNKNIIAYLLSTDAEESIYKSIQSFKQKDIAFYMEKNSESNFKISMITIDNKSEFLSSNRMIFVNDKFYPLVFDTDYNFYIPVSDGYPIVTYEKEKNVNVNIRIPSLDERIKNFHLYGYPQKTIILDNTLYWIVGKKGELISTNSKG